MLTSRKTDATSATVLKVLGDPLRRRIVELLAGEELCTCHLVEETGAGQTLVDANPSGRDAVVGKIAGAEVAVGVFPQAVVEGTDGRVFVLNGEAFAALKRMPKAGDFRANLHVGGQ